MRGVSVAFAASLLMITPAAAWMRYGSERYGTSVEVPDDYHAMPAPENGDGRTLVAPRGRARVAVFAAQDVLNEGFSPPAGVAISYHAHGRGWSVYSGTQGSTSVYERMMAACPDHHLIHHVRIEYEHADEAGMAGIVARIAASLRGGCTD